MEKVLIFYEQSIKENEKVLDLLNENPPETDIHEEEELKKIRQKTVSRVTTMMTMTSKMMRMRKKNQRIASFADVFKRQQIYYQLICGLF